MGLKPVQPRGLLRALERVGRFIPLWLYAQFSGLLGNREERESQKTECTKTQS